jgi:hypothetical protein
MTLFSELISAFAIHRYSEFGPNSRLAQFDAFPLADLFSLSRFEWLLEQPGAFKSVRLTKDHIDINPYDTCYDNDIRSIPLLLHLSRGATCIFHNADMRDRDLHRLCRDAEQWSGAAVNCNVYLSPAYEKAFPPHTDPYDVLVVQISGEKRWFIQEADSSQEVVYDMRPGTVLFIPQGVPHHAVPIGTVSPYSLHLTFAFFQATPSHLVAEGLRQLKCTQHSLGSRRRPFTHQSVDISVSDQARDVLLNSTHELISAVEHPDFFTSILDKMRKDSINQMKSSFDGALHSVLKARHMGGINYESSLRVTANPICFNRMGLRTSIHTKNHDLTVPFPFYMVIRVLSNKSTFQIMDIANNEEKELFYLLCDILLKRGILLIEDD